MRKILLPSMVLIALFAGGIVGAQKKQTVPPTKGSINKLQQGLKQTQEKKNQVLEKLQEKRQAAKKVKRSIGEVESRLGQVVEKLSETSDSLDSARYRQERIAAELKIAEANLKKTNELVRKRLKRMYKRGQDNLFSALLSSRSTGDVASRKYLIERVAKKDREVFEAFKTQRATVDRKKREQDGIVSRIARLAADQRDQQVELESARREKEELLGGLQSEMAQLRRMVAQFERDERQIEAQIAEAIRRAQEAAKNRKPGDKTPPPIKFSGRFGRPTGGPITSGFGSRFHPILKRRRLHAGIDFGGGYGAPVYAAAEGTVISASTLGGYGNTIIIDHGSGMSTVYAHLSRIHVSSGSRVRRGQKIGAIGSTGLSTGPHLHFEIRRNGKAVNPASYL